MKVITAPTPQGVLARADAFVQRLRDAIDARIRAVLPGDDGAIAAMLIDGKRDAIAPNVYDALFVSGIGHVLSISDYHMAVVAGVIFFIVRAFFALIPGLADRAPIKKWAALAALLVTGFYLILCGNQVATQRSFIMIGVVLLGVLFDRPALTMRTLTIAALVVLVFAPESIVHPSFQMSFAATLALIAGYERGAMKLRSRADSSLGARAALWGVNEIVGLTIASLLAGLATTPYAAYHFHRIAPYGVIANLLAMPVVSVWVMPMGILGIVTMPLGLDAEFWRQMGYGIEWMNAVGLWVATLLRPGRAVRRWATIAGDRRVSGHRVVENPAALEWRRSGNDRCGLGRIHAAAGRADRRRWPRFRGSGHRWPARGASWRRQFRRARMARRRRRRPRCPRPEPASGDRLRSVRVYRQARRRSDDQLRAHPGGIRGRLCARRPRYRKPRRAAGGLPGGRHWPRAVASTRRTGDAPNWH